MSRSINEQRLQIHLAAEIRHDMAATLDTLHPECLFFDDPLGLRFEGHAGASRHYDMWWSGFGVTLDDTSSELHWVADELVVGESAFLGRHEGTFAGIPATGCTIRLPFVVFVRFRDGLLIGERFVYDLNTLLRQLGQPSFDPSSVAAR